MPAPGALGPQPPAGSGCRAAGPRCTPLIACLAAPLHQQARRMLTPRLPTTQLQISKCTRVPHKRLLQLEGDSFCGPLLAVPFPPLMLDGYCHRHTGSVNFSSLHSYTGAASGFLATPTSSLTQGKRPHTLCTSHQQETTCKAAVLRAGSELAGLLPVMQHCRRTERRHSCRCGCMQHSVLNSPLP